MFKKKKIEVSKETVPDKSKRPIWKNCLYCSKCLPCNGDSRVKRCGDTHDLVSNTYNITLVWDRCDGFTPIHGCVTCNKRKYCEIDHMNKIYADEKVTTIRWNDCSEWVILTEIDSMMKHEGE